MHAWLAAVGTLALLGLCSAQAWAMPAFARKYTAPCGLCHDQAFPALNAVGLRFKESGYQLEPEAEARYRGVHSSRPDPEERLALLNAVPLSLRAQGGITFATDPRSSGDDAVDLRPLDRFYLLAGASLYPDVSFVASLTLAPGLALHHGAIGFHNLIFGAGHLNLRVGRLLLFDFQRPEHRFLTGFGNPIATTPVGLNPTVLDSTQDGMDVFGRVLGNRLFYRVALLQGAQGPDGVRDLDGHKDLFAEAQVTLGRFTLGAFGHRGRTQITDDSGGLVVRFTDAFHAEGASLALEAGPLELYGQALQVHHQNPSGDGEHANHWAYRLEARALLTPRWLLLARYDQLGSHHLSSQAFQHATVHLGYLLLTNLRLAVESNIPFNRIDTSALALRLDLAL